MRCKIALGAIIALASTPVWAASSETEAFAARTRLSVTFLQQTSALAVDRSESASVLDASADELRTQPDVIAALDRRTMPMVAAGQTLARADDVVETGRSVSVAPAISTTRFIEPIGTGATMSAALVTVERLSASKGGAFDRLFTASQVAVLKDLQTAYEAYAQTGDDPVLRQVARAEADESARRVAILANTASGAQD